MKHALPLLVARSFPLLAPLLWALTAPAGAQPSSPPPGGIYTCLDAQGRRVSADRPIAECLGKEQLLLNRDGSVRAVIPPTLTAEERAEKEARERNAAESRVTQADALRRDRNLIARFPNEAAHNRAREAALDTLRQAIKASELRLRELEAESKPLREESEFYLGKALPPKLKAAVDANDASMEAQRASSTNQAAELMRINKLFDAELDRLRRLWAGAQPGSLGPMPPPPPGPATVHPSSGADAKPAAPR